MVGQGGAFFNSLDRYELKYLVSPEQIDPLTRYLETYCELDYHSEHAPEQFYCVNSLYFDTPNYLFFKNRLHGKNPRFNLRARAYGDTPKPPYFLEIKRKDSGVVNKYRLTLHEDEWPHFFTDPDYTFGAGTDDHETRSLFYRTALKYAVAPKIITQYYRRAFVSNVDDYARVTLDINLRYAREERFSFVPENGFSAYDNPQVFARDTENGLEKSVILELKCLPHSVPLWMVDMIRHFQLSRTTFSKYTQSMLVATQYDPFFNTFHNLHDRMTNH